MAKKGSGAGFGIGGSSILVIFVLLCLTTFATLSLVSANADLRLTERAASVTKEYYAADSTAEQILADIDAYLIEQRNLGLTPQEYALTSMPGIQTLFPDATIQALDNNELRVLYNVTMNEKQAISVALRVLSNENQQTRYVREQWQVISTGEWNPSADGFTLWNGDDAALGLPPVS